MKALVLAGGRGANMVPFCTTRPKPLIPVAGEYVIDHTLRLLQSAGITTINMVVGHKGDVLKERIDKDRFGDMNIHFIDQGKSGGIGAAALSAKKWFSPDESFMMVYSDTLTTSNIFSVTYQAHCLNNGPSAAVSHAKSSENYGNVYLGKEARITKIVEKPDKNEGLANYVLSGIFVVGYSLFDYLEKNDTNMEKALATMIAKEKVQAAIWENDWLDLARPWDILSANKAIMDTWSTAKIHESVKLQGASVKGPVRIAKGAEISSGAVLEGPSYIGPGSFIGHNALIRPYTSIGAGSVIGQSVEMKNCVLFPKVIVGRMCFIGDSVVGENVDIGAGVMTINHTMDNGEISVRINKKKTESGLTKLGAFIGDNAIIGASNTIESGAIIDAGIKIDHNLSVNKTGRSVKK